MEPQRLLHQQLVSKAAYLHTRERTISSSKLQFEEHMQLNPKSEGIFFLDYEERNLRRYSSKKPESLLPYEPDREKYTYLVSKYEENLCRTETACG